MRLDTSLQKTGSGSVLYDFAGAVFNLCVFLGVIFSGTLLPLVLCVLPNGSPSFLHSGIIRLTINRAYSWVYCSFNVSNWATGLRYAIVVKTPTKH